MTQTVLGSEINREKKLQAIQSVASDSLGDDLWLCQIVSSWLLGLSALPDYLGLNHRSFQLLRGLLSLELNHEAISGIKLDLSRMLERDDLIHLLQKNAQTQYPETEIISQLVVAGCLGDDHLWRDLGLWSRRDLTSLLKFYFPELAGRNTANMKWKKFLYKQLCDEEGLSLCRAPSCNVCSDHGQCFGSEED